MKFIRESTKINVEAINDSCIVNSQLLVKSAEDSFDGQLDHAAELLISVGEKMVFLTGPSASGKTTTAQMIIDRLNEHGKTAIRISLDNFYKDSDKIPLWEKDGRKNYETIESLDLENLKNVFDCLSLKGEADFPIFDFIAGKKSEKTFHVSLKDNSFIILEGIHALNPVLTSKVECLGSTKIYISPHSIFTDRSGNIILGTQELRLIRRILRDYCTRGASADRTIEMWSDVLKGEQEYIRPYRCYSDIHINSTHSYEPLVYKEFLIDALANSDIQKFADVKNRLLSALNCFENLDKALIPKNSLLTEFLPSIFNNK